jgi:hypothetical protein
MALTLAVGRVGNKNFFANAAQNRWVSSAMTANDSRPSGIVNASARFPALEALVTHATLDWTRAVQRTIPRRPAKHRPAKHRPATRPTRLLDTAAV